MMSQYDKASTIFDMVWEYFQCITTNLIVLMWSWNEVAWQFIVGHHGNWREIK